MFQFQEHDSQIFDEDIFDRQYFPKQAGGVEEMTNLQLFSLNSEQRISLNNQKSQIDEELFSQSSSSKKKPRQSNTNLLKNLVVTIRTWVKFDHYDNNSAERYLWEYFKQSSKINKNMLLMLFGCQKSTICKFESIFVNGECCCKHLGVDKILAAQQNIRNEVLRQLQEADIEFILKNRRIKNKQEFDKYFYKFVNHIQNGGISHKRNQFN